MHVTQPKKDDGEVVEISSRVRRSLPDHWRGYQKAIIKFYIKK